MFNHISLASSHFAQSKKFYKAALAPLGIQLKSDGKEHAGFGLKAGIYFWLGKGKPRKLSKHIHIAFSAKTHKEVDAFYKAAIKAGGKSNGEPGLRPQYSPSYYAAFVFDPDGNNIEAVCR